VLSASSDYTVRSWSTQQDHEPPDIVYGVAAVHCVAAHGTDLMAGDARGNVWFLTWDKPDAVVRDPSEA
jgi:hypothetical protein